MWKTMTVWKIAYGASLSFSHFEIHSPAWVHQAKSILPEPCFALDAKGNLDPARGKRGRIQDPKYFYDKQWFDPCLTNIIKQRLVGRP